MAGPWEKYRQQQGPWTKYASPESTATPPKTPAPQEGFVSSLLHGFGLPGSMAEAEAEGKQQAQPGTIMKNALLGPAGQLAEGVYQGGKRMAGEVGRAYDAYKNGNTAGVVQHAVTALPFVGPALDKASDQYADKNYSGALGTLIPAAAQVAPMAEGVPGARAVYSPLADAAEGALKGSGGALRESGIGTMNRTVGSLKADFKRGANPGQAYLEAGGGPAASMQSLANKGLALKGEVGGKIADARDAATNSGMLIPTGKVAKALAPAIKTGMDLETGPGGMGNVGPLDTYAKSFTPAFDQANAAGGFTPNEVFEMKRSIASGTNWADPSQFNLKAIRQQNTGALSGVLTEAIPELDPLNSQYQGLLNFAKRAQSRADTHSMPLTSIGLKTALSAAGAGVGVPLGHPLLGAITGAALDSVPFKTGLATGLYRGGGGLTALGDFLPTPLPNRAAMAIPAYSLKQSPKKKNEEDGQ